MEKPGALDLVPFGIGDEIRNVDGRRYEVLSIGVNRVLACPSAYPQAEVIALEWSRIEEPA